MGVYDFTVKTNRGVEKSLSDYKGKVLLIVNTASKCGFTPQFKELQELYTKYNARGFEILGFPCNQFAGQEPGTNDEVQTFCRVNYGVTFQIFEKGDVRGENASRFSNILPRRKNLKVLMKIILSQNLYWKRCKRIFPNILRATVSNGISRNF